MLSDAYKEVEKNDCSSLNTVNIQSMNTRCNDDNLVRDKTINPMVNLAKEESDKSIFSGSSHEKTIEPTSKVPSKPIISEIESFQTTQTLDIMDHTETMSSSSTVLFENKGPKKTISNEPFTLPVIPNAPAEIYPLCNEENCMMDLLRNPPINNPFINIKRRQAFFLPAFKRPEKYSTFKLHSEDQLSTEMVYIGEDSYNFNEIRVESKQKSKKQKTEILFKVLYKVIKVELKKLVARSKKELYKQHIIRNDKKKPTYTNPLKEDKDPLTIKEVRNPILKQSYKEIHLPRQKAVQVFRYNDKKTNIGEQFKCLGGSSAMLELYLDYKQINNLIPDEKNFYQCYRDHKKSSKLQISDTNKFEKDENLYNSSINIRRAYENRKHQIPAVSRPSKPIQSYHVIQRRHINNKINLAKMFRNTKCYFFSNQIGSRYSLFTSQLEHCLPISQFQEYNKRYFAGLIKSWHPIYQSIYKVDDFMEENDPHGSIRSIVIGPRRKLWKKDAFKPCLVVPKFVELKESYLVEYLHPLVAKGNISLKVDDETAVSEISILDPKTFKKSLQRNGISNHLIKIKLMEMIKSDREVFEIVDYEMKGKFYIFINLLIEAHIYNHNQSDKVAKAAETCPHHLLREEIYHLMVKYFFDSPADIDWGFQFLEFAGVSPASITGTQVFTLNFDKSVGSSVQYVACLLKLHLLVNKKTKETQAFFQKVHQLHYLRLLCSFLQSRYVKKFILRSLLFHTDNSINEIRPSSYYYTKKAECRQLKLKSSSGFSEDNYQQFTAREQQQQQQQQQSINFWKMEKIPDSETEVHDEFNKHQMKEVLLHTLKARRFKHSSIAPW